jgi:hypothetical protein
MVKGVKVKGAKVKGVKVKGVKAEGGKVVMGDQERRRNRRRRRFLRCFLEQGRFDLAAAYAGVTVGAVRGWLVNDEEFAACFALVKEAFVESLELEADRRGVRGVCRLRFYRNKPIVDARTKKVLIVRKYSDRLLMFRLSGLKPEMYGESGRGGREEKKYVMGYRSVGVEEGDGRGSGPRA